MQPTKEQQRIIKAIASGKNILVSAFAGTGKTTTLVMSAKAHPQKSGLYLAYNKSLQVEAKNKFPRHITCVTMHSLAYKETGVKYRVKLNIKNYARVIVEALKLMPVNTPHPDNASKNIYITPTIIAGSARDAIRRYCYSTDGQISSRHLDTRFLEKIHDEHRLSEEYDLDYLDEPRNFSESLLAHVLQVSQKLWKSMIDLDNQTIGIEHDGYLKLYQLSKPIIEQYDYIMVDEAQDANPVILDILENQNTQIIYVGDQNQQIYGWRGSVNAMCDLRHSCEHYYLTQSFRFGRAIADEANRYLKMLNEPVELKGLKSIESQVSKVDITRPFTILNRKNATLLDKALELTKSYPQKHIAIVGGIKNVITLFESGYWLWKNNLSRVKHPQIRLFISWKKLQQEALICGNSEIRGVFNFVSTYKNEALKILDKLGSHCTYTEKTADIILSTAHKAKGREWDQVVINDDFPLILATACKDSIVNLWYVSVTRAHNVLEILPYEKKHKKPMLTIELVPETCWYSNVRSNVVPYDWNKLKKLTFKNAGYRCEICGGQGENHPVECHEIWHYDDRKKIQRLNGLIALCPNCHEVNHMGLANIEGRRGQAAKHLAYVNNWNEEKTETYIDGQFKMWQKRSCFDWDLDISWLEKVGVKATVTDRDRRGAYKIKRPAFEYM